MPKLTSEHDAVLQELIHYKNNNAIVGRHERVPIEVYHHPECPGLSKSDLSLIHRSWDHYKANKYAKANEGVSNSPERNRALVIGSAVHESILEPEIFERKYAVPPGLPKVDRRTKEGKALFEKWQAEVYTPWADKNQGKVELSCDEMSMTLAMCALAKHHKQLQTVLNGAKKEATYFWEDEQTGLLLKARPDAVNDELNVLYDHKTTADASFVQFRKSIVNYYYDMQAAMQIDGVKAVTGKEYDFVFGAQEKEPPYGLALYRLNEAAVDVGRQLYRRDVEYAAKVLSGDKNTPTCYPEEIVPMDLPSWAFDLSSR